MDCNIDLRYVVPAVVSLIFVVLPSEDNPWIQHNHYIGFESLAQPIFVMACLVLAIVVLFFLFTSVNLPLTLQPIFLQTRHFSISWSLSLLASLLLPPSHFWLVFPILLIISRWDTMTLDRVLSCFLQAIPARIILCFPQRQEEPEPPTDLPPPPQVEIEVNENEERSATRT